MADGSKDQISLKVLRLLEIKLNEHITTFFDGELKMEAISKYDLPLLSIETLGGSLTNETSGTVKDAEDINFRIIVWFDRRKNYTNKEDGEQGFNVLQRDLKNIVQGRNADMSLKDDSIIGVIRDNIKLDGQVMYTDDIEYSYEASVEESENPLGKATITFSAHLRTIR